MITVRSILVEYLARSKVGFVFVDDYRKWDPMRRIKSRINEDILIEIYKNLYLDPQIIVSDWLNDNDYDGLYNEVEGCSCIIENLFQCSCRDVLDTCKVGYKVDCTPKCHHEIGYGDYYLYNWHVQAKKPEKSEEEKNLLCKEFKQKTSELNKIYNEIYYADNFIIKEDRDLQIQNAITGLNIYIKNRIKEEMISKWIYGE